MLFIYWSKRLHLTLFTKQLESERSELTNMSLSWKAQSQRSRSELANGRSEYVERKRLPFFFTSITLQSNFEVISQPTRIQKLRFATFFPTGW